MEHLQKLQLDNNIICKIQNLDHLTELRWLDLSFNLIEKIEGLDSLTKLTDLSLYNNHISEIGGLNTLHELNVLSLGKNELQPYDKVVSYLKEFPNKLEVLTLMGNPGTKENEQGYKYHVIAYLKDLKYLDYKVIDSELRYQAEETHKEEMTEKETAKAADKGDDQAPMFNKEHIEQLREAKILCTEDLF